MSEAPEISTELQSLVDTALAVRENAYAPYSKFSVGAALLSDAGEVFVGCNVENASYGLCICAERSAICNAVANEQTKFQAIAIAATPLASPCGACRQFLVEFGQDITVICVDADEPKRMNVWTSGQLIPDSFSFESAKE